jgi:hypothetical protein
MCPVFPDMIDFVRRDVVFVNSVSFCSREMEVLLTNELIVLCRALVAKKWRVA